MFLPLRSNQIEQQETSVPLQAITHRDTHTPTPICVNAFKPERGRNTRYAKHTHTTSSKGVLTLGNLYYAQELLSPVKVQFICLDHVITVVPFIWPHFGAVHLDLLERGALMYSSVVLMHSANRGQTWKSYAMIFTFQFIRKY